MKLGATHGAKTVRRSTLKRCQLTAHFRLPLLQSVDLNGSPSDTVVDRPFKTEPFDSRFWSVEAKTMVRHKEKDK